MKHFSLAVAVCLFAHASVAVECEYCSPEELYSENIKQLKLMARDMKDLDETLENLSPAAIDVLQSMMEDLDLDGVSRTAMAVALSNKAKKDSADMRESEIERLNKEEDIARLKAQVAEAKAREAEAVSQQDPMSLIVSRTEAEAFVTGDELVEGDAVGAGDAPLLERGVFVTFVFADDSTAPEKRAVVISLDGKAVSLKVGSSFEYDGKSYELSGIKSAFDREDNRKWDVFVSVDGRKELTKLEWAG
jgi:hypothetical protein